MWYTGDLLSLKSARLLKYASQCRQLQLTSSCMSGSRVSLRALLLHRWDQWLRCVNAAWLAFRPLFYPSLFLATEA